MTSPHTGSNDDYPANIAEASRLMSAALVYILSPQELRDKIVVVTDNETKVHEDKGLMVIRFKFVST